MARLSFRARGDDFRKWRLAATSVALAAAALVAPSGVAAASAAEPVVTDFALSANGYSTDVRGGVLPLQSGRSGFAGTGCIRLANTEVANDTAAINLPADRGIVRVGATTTRAFTSKQGATVSSHGHNDVANVLVGDKSVAALQINGIRTRTRAWHDASGYHRHEAVQVARVTRWVGGEQNEVVSIAPHTDLNGAQLGIPGLATLTFGLKAGSVSDNAAFANAIALRIDLEATATTITVGSATARIQGGAVNGVMNGEVWGSQLTGLGGVLNSGRTAQIELPCLGTKGAYKVQRVAGVGLPGVVTLGEIISSVRGSQGPGEPWAQGVSTVTRASFIGRGLVVTGIRAEGVVKRRPDGSFLRHAVGTTVGTIEVAGRQFDIPLPGRTLVIPGVARITRGVVEKPGNNSIKVVGLRVELLQGSVIESRVDLANVRLQVRRG
jgi:hypothetical protein